MTTENPPPAEPTEPSDAADGPPTGPQGGWVQAPPRHPQATIVLVLGILGIVACGVLAPIAWYLGSKAMTEINANPAAYSGQSEVNTGRILGIVGTALLALAVIVLMVGLVVLLIGAAASGGFHSGSPARY